jgi:autotransporter strand-loop-strand O-heptosyltransferase
MEEVFISYVSEIPLEGDSPKVFIKSDLQNNYTVKFYDNSNGELVVKNLKSNEFVIGERQWFTEWFIQVFRNDEDIPFYYEQYNANNKVVFIKMDAYALGDNIAWIPYVEEFRKKHNCTVICSTFYNDIFIKNYPNILFIQPNTKVHNVYAQYYIGASDSGNYKYSPVQSKKTKLQNVASSILGINYEEKKPDLSYEFKDTNSRFNRKYVCISEFASNEAKFWKEINGWQNVVDYLNYLGYVVVAISREKTNLKNVLDLTGDKDLKERMLDLYHCEFFIGVSSGLSWLAWSLNKKVIMISDGTPENHEFCNNCIRLCANNLDEVSFDNYENITNFEEVKKEIDNLIYEKSRQNENI